MGQTPVAPHRLLLELGRGGMGTVYLALVQGPAGFSKLKVVKRLSYELADDPQFLTMFLDEARISARLNHPNIVQANEVGYDGRHYFIEMEYLEGQTLAFVLTPGPQGTGCPQALALWILAQALSGLHCAHELRDHDEQPLQIVHRDVSPHNVFVTYEGAVKVLDFGIAKAADSSIETRTGVVKGKAKYMAPEQVNREKVDRRADVYAVGIMLWQILTGRRLYEGLLDEEIFLKARAPSIPAPKSVVPSVPAALDAICMKALARQPEARFETADRFQAALEDHLHSARQPVGPRQLAAFMGERFAKARADVRAEIDAHVRTGGEDRSSIVPSLHEALESRRNVPVAPPTGQAAKDEPAPASETTPQVPAAKHGNAPEKTLSVALVAGRLTGLGARTAVGRAALGLAAALSMGGLVWLVHRGLKPVPSPAPAAASAHAALAGNDRRSMLLLGIENLTSDPLLEWTLDAVMDSALYRSLVVLPYSGSALRRLSAELEGESAALDEHLGPLLIARSGGRVLTVRGSVAPKGTGYALSIRATDAATRSTVLDRTVDAADGSQLVPALGRLASELRAAIGDAPSNGMSPEATGMSASIEADHELVVGRAASQSGKYQDGVVHLERAIALDVDFAEAHEALATTYLSLGRQADAIAQYELARRGLDGMGRHAQLSFLGHYYIATGEFRRSAETFADLLRQWPGDENAEMNMSIPYVADRDFARAIEAAKLAAADHPRNVLARANLVGFYVEGGDFTTALAEAEKVVGEFPHPPPDTYLYIGIASFALGRVDDARAAYSKMQAVDPSRATMAFADLAMAEGRSAESEKLLRDGIAVDLAQKNKDGALGKKAMLAELLLARGERAASAGPAAEALEAMAVDPATTYMAARVLIATGRERAALQAATRLQASPSADTRAFGKLIAGEAARALGRPRDAASMLEEAAALSNSWSAHFGLARAYLDLGAYTEAYTELQTCLARRGENTLVFLDDRATLRYVPLVHYYLARAQEGLGSPAAKASYEAFLNNRKSTDPDVLANDARHRLAAR